MKPGWDFAVGRSNRLAAQAAVQLATSAETPFAMLVVQGAGGSGKTELLRMAARMHGVLRAGATMVQASAHDLAVAPDVEEALGTQLLGCQLLLIDDFDVLVRRRPVDEDALLGMLDYMSRDGRRVMLTTSTAVVDLQRIEPRLLSRLAGGVVVDLELADQDLREAIIRRRAGAWQLDLTAELVTRLAVALGGNGHLLTGAVNRLGIRAATDREPFGEEDLEQDLAELLRATPRISVAHIQERVAHYFRIPVREMTSQRRARDVARPRQVAMYLSKQLTPQSLPDIGRRFGGRDHTTVIHGIRQVEKLRLIDQDLDVAVTCLARELQH